jgi:hypothetical protein
MFFAQKRGIEGAAFLIGLFRESMSEVAWAISFWKTMIPYIFLAAKRRHREYIALNKDGEPLTQNCLSPEPCGEASGKF